MSSMLDKQTFSNPSIESGGDRFAPDAEQGGEILMRLLPE